MAKLCNFLIQLCNFHLNFVIFMTDLAQKQREYLIKILTTDPKSEKQLQNKCAEVLAKCYPEHRRRFVCVNNNDKHHNSQNLGIVEGASDTYWLAEYGRTIYIEFKFDNNRQSKDQQLFEAQCLRLGHDYRLCYLYETFWNLIGLKQPQVKEIDRYLSGI